MGDINWFIKKAMNNVMQSQQNKIGLTTDFQHASVNIDQDTLAECLVTLAHIVKEHGDDYLPIFERIKNELDEYNHSQNIKEIALSIAEQNSKILHPVKMYNNHPTKCTTLKI